MKETQRRKMGKAPWLFVIIAAMLSVATPLAVGGTVVFASCTSKEESPTIGRIQQRGTLLVGTTGDYRPLSFYEPETGEYWGFGIEMAQAIADRLGVGSSL